MKTVFTNLVLFALAFAAKGQSDTTIIVFEHKIGKRIDTILRQDHLRLKDKDGNVYVGPFKKFKDGYIYTNRDTIHFKKLQFIAVNSMQRQKIGSAYMAGGISGILNLAGVNAAFSSSEADTLTGSESSALSTGLTAGYTIMAGVLVYGVVLYNAYNRYTIFGRKKSWEIIVE